MNKTLFCILIGLGSMGLAKAQNIDTVYAEDIRTVQFFPVGVPNAMPIAYLKSGKLVLSFDDISSNLKDYIYTIEQCDRDWQPSRLEKIEYLEGLQEDRLTQYANAKATNISYVHYQLSVPNDVMRLNKSGNYVLKVMLDDADKTPVLTRRFVVAEEVVSVAPNFVPANALRYNSHQDLHFNINMKTFRIANPVNELRATIVQNGRWDKARQSIPPQYVQGELAVYDYVDSLTFAAGKEWRYVDLRSTRFRSERVLKIEQSDETWYFILRPDLDRSLEPYLIYPDLNGGFFIETQDYGNYLENNATQADYVDALFALKRNEAFEDADVYVFGRLTDWQIDPRFKMTYDEQKRLYEADIRLKQGFYNYIYAVVPHATGQPDFEALEGNWFGAENDYTILVYYRPFGARYDRVIGVARGVKPATR